MKVLGNSLHCNLIAETLFEGVLTIINDENCTMPTE